MFHHRTVLLQPAIERLAPVAGGTYIDATFGGGGHSLALLEASAPNGRVIGLDRDPDAIAHGQRLVEGSDTRLSLHHTPFSGLSTVLETVGPPAPDGILFDLGVSSHQLDRAERGFSFRHDGPLDMRMNGKDDHCPTAADLVNTLEQEALANLLYTYGEERRSRRAARAILQHRKSHPLTTTGALADLLARVLPRNKKGHHPATRCFQALRIAVNGELDELQSGLDQAMKQVAVGGRVAVISFHSLEDRIVKRAFQAACRPRILLDSWGRQRQRDEALFRPVTRKPIEPDARETDDNPRARSARLRVVERTASERNDDYS
ncbi:MAG: 16S rRNA (cytosine(1402)-N(4))-methyltransferase RsmH [Magnetococcales bacterium]|nr:16S rRNA (cytosine(1402)-N(4))-methyltransferase RsmH [Magnetococcales bacterium]